VSAPDVNTEHPLELEKPRFSVKQPKVRCDTQGDMPDAERVQKAMQNFVRDFGRTAAIYMETCVHCGMCAHACHFYVTTENPKYTPIWKLEPFKQAYKREYGPFALFYRAFGLKAKVTVEELQEWQALLYDSCTVCGRCSLMCPMGIDIASLISLARHGMFQAGLVPHELWAVAERGHREGSPLGAKPEVFKDRLEWLADDHEIDIPLNKDKADVLCTMSSIEIMKYPDSIVATAKILNSLGVNWTFRSDGYEATNFGLLSGNSQWQKEISMKLINAAIACGANTLILPECGHAYGALRWMGANMYGKPLPFRVMHIAEYLAENVQNGKLKLKKLAKTVTFHDPCQIVRRGGVIEAPRIVLEALGAQLTEMEPAKATGWCCGGGGGVVTIHRADPLRYKVFQLKMEQIEATGAEIPVTTCANCRQTFDDGQAHFHWDKTMNSLLELVADNLAEKSS
jgi:Fe-S oxidoreductase